MSASEMINPSALQRPGEVPALMVGVVLEVNVSTGQLVVQVPELDGGAAAKRPFGSYPNAVAGDEVRVSIDSTGGLTVVAWEPADG